MPLPLFNFPFLVQKAIFKHMPLADNFIVSTLSKRARAIIRSSFAAQQFQLAIDYDGEFRLSRDELDFFSIEFNNIEFMRSHDYELRSFLNEEFVPVKMEVSAQFVDTYWADEKAVFYPAIEYFATTFPKLKVDLEVEVYDLQRFLKTIRLFQNLNVELGHIFVMTTKEFGDELAKFALEECKDADSLHLKVRTSPDFTYEGAEPFNFKRLAIDQASWVTRDHITNLFMNCESLTLGDVEFSDEDYKAIFQKWIEGSSMKKLEAGYSGNLFSSIFDNMEGVVEVKFEDEPAYQITQEDGTTAIVYKFHQHLYFKILVDEKDEEENDNLRRIAEEFQEFLFGDFDL